MGHIRPNPQYRRKYIYYISIYLGEISYLPNYNTTTREVRLPYSFLSILRLRDHVFPFPVVLQFCFFRHSIFFRQYSRSIATYLTMYDNEEQIDSVILPTAPYQLRRVPQRLQHHHERGSIT